MPHGTKLKPALAALGAAVNGSMGAAASPPPPNIVVLFVDDMGINQIDIPVADRGIYGYTGDDHSIPTPNLAQFAREGMVFQTWYSSFHVCSPSRASMMTGRLSVRSGVGIPGQYAPPSAPGYKGPNVVFTAESIGGLPLNETTTAEALKTVGYNTLMLGKWHLGQRSVYLPSSRGFDEYYGIPFSQDMGTSFWEPKVVNPPFQPTPLPLLNGTTIVEQPVDLGTLNSRYADRAVAYIERQAALQRTQQARGEAASPFYLYFSFNHIHAPASCGPAFCGSSSHGPVGDAVAETDHAIGRVMAALKSAGVDDDTIVFFTSDNGAHLTRDKAGNLPLRGGKGNCWEGGFREPGMVRWPGVVPAGSTTQEIGTTYDIHTTILGLADVPLPTDRVMDGIDLMPVLRNESGAKGHSCVMFYHYAVAADANNTLWAVRCGDYKAFWSTDGDIPGHPGGKQAVPLLFNLVTDPIEAAPIDPSSAEYAAAMATILPARAAHLASVDPYVPNQNGRGSDPALALCSAPGSAPHNCTLNPENWVPAEVCASEACLKANHEFAAPCGNSTPSPSPVPRENYKGCFLDHQGADEPCDLQYVVSGHCPNATARHKGAMTLEACNAACARQGFPFFGAQNGGSGCFCGVSFGSQGAAPADSDCNMTCAGNATEVCGGPDRNSVYATVLGLGES